MYYYRNKRKKSNKVQQHKTTFAAPLNDVWESFQEPKSYKDFGISDEAFTFLSDKEKCKQIRDKNKYWKSKKSWIEKIKDVFSLTSIVLFVVTILLFSDGHDTEGIVSVALFGVSITIIFILKIPDAIIKRKLIESYDGIESKYNSYLRYLERYNIEKSQYLTHIQELNDFKTNKEIIERLLHYWYVK